MIHFKIRMNSVAIPDLGFKNHYSDRKTGQKPFRKKNHKTRWYSPVFQTLIQIHGPINYS
jgi:hypothetical protein